MLFHFKCLLFILVYFILLNNYTYAQDNLFAKVLYDSTGKGIYFYKLITPDYSTGAGKLILTE